MHDTEAGDWAREQFGSAEFGDARRVYRAVRMLQRAAEMPAGRLSAVFNNAADRQAAYDFVRGSVPPESIIAALGEATLRAVRTKFIYAVIDGSSLSLADPSGTRDFGSVGMRSLPTRGLKCVTSIAVEPTGAPLGLLDLEIWTRESQTESSRYVRRASGTTEVARWQAVIERVTCSALSAGVLPWVLIDREGDCGQMLLAVASSGAKFTIRAAQDRNLVGEPRRLHAHMRRQPVRARHFVDVPATRTRQARTATLDVRYATVTLALPVRATGERVSFEVNVVWACERHKPRSGPRLDWMLLTNAAIGSYADAVGIIESYCHRWRIEDFHRAWKRGYCRVEETQLHRRDHVVRWAAMLAAVANRAERLKFLARTEPASPATIELTDLEVKALIAVKRAYLRKRGEVVPDDVPTIATAVEWIASYGGFTGKSSGGPPGTMTIARGLERLAPFAAGFALGLKTAAR